MAIMLYQSQLTSEKTPENNKYFTKNELKEFFKEYEKLNSLRLDENNIWCLYGSKTIYNTIEYNSIASDLCGVDVYSPLLIIHDSEINPEWKMSHLTNETYSDFYDNVMNDIIAISQELLKTIKENEMAENGEDTLPYLETVGETTEEPKRVFFYFDPDKQSENFYKSNNLNILCEKAYDYISVSENKYREPFIMYEDVKAIVSIPKDKIIKFADIIINYFLKEEEYEKCDVLKNLKINWEKKLHESK